MDELLALCVAMQLVIWWWARWLRRLQRGGIERRAQDAEGDGGHRRVTIHVVTSGI